MSRPSYTAMGRLFARYHARTLSTAAIAAWWYLWAQASNWIAEEAIEQIAAACGYSYGTARRATTELRKAGFVRQETRGRKNVGPSRWRLLPLRNKPPAHARAADDDLQRRTGAPKDSPPWIPPDNLNSAPVRRTNSAPVGPTWKGNRTADADAPLLAAVGGAELESKP